MGLRGPLRQSRVKYWEKVFLCIEDKTGNAEGKQSGFYTQRDAFGDPEAAVTMVKGSTDAWILYGDQRNCSAFKRNLIWFID